MYANLEFTILTYAHASLQLWYANPGISHPDFSLMASPNSMQLINVGRVYKAKWDDTVEKVSDRFGITVQRLKDLNADLAALKPTDTMAVEQVHSCRFGLFVRMLMFVCSYSCACERAGARGRTG